jgi:YbbR domain-containing protein
MKFHISENTSYKIVALFVTFVLWLTLVSRRDAVVSRQMALQVLLPPHIALANPLPKTVSLKLTGARLVLQKYLESEDDIALDLTRMPPGHSKVHLSQNNLSLPLGIRVIAVDPDELLVNLRETTVGDTK